MRFIFAALGLAIFAGVWVLTEKLDTHWRIMFSVLVAAPLLLIPDLLRGERKRKPD